MIFEKVDSPTSFSNLKALSAVPDKNSSRFAILNRRLKSVPFAGKHHQDGEVQRICATVVVVMVMSRRAAAEVCDD